ncbi:MAG: family 10 glycosylhydrolase [Bacteroidota bacterium]|nr:family 10 glycosylhydrolase [Bacteroidota bacterium]MDP4206060.1 family 10 glycosylhydrolase [Bacteroidota bacterium]
MTKLGKISILFFFLAMTTAFCNGQKVQLISPQREFRGAWIATVANIDWPSRPGLSSESMLKEIVSLLDKMQADGINAVIVQVRPTADAMYHSATEPWSQYITGEQGKAPDRGFDPLAAFIGEAHKRHMELHAWFNPFRVSNSAKSRLSQNNVARLHPEWTVSYDDKLYLDPGIPEVRSYLSKVIAEVVRNYDIDAIHFDDYFYPYKVEDKEFPDQNSFRKYKGQFVNRNEWRRANVDGIIQNISNTIKNIKPWVKFGISPFGVWRNQSQDPRGSATRAGTTNYDDLYADVIKWQRLGWIDYLLPQIYWEAGHPTVDFVTLANWWAKNGYGRSVYIGHALYKVTPKVKGAWGNSSELTRQIRTVRKIEGLNGSAFYSAKHFSRDLMGFQDSLKKRLYKEPALPPVMPWLDNTIPSSPLNLKIEKVKKGYHIEWEASVQNTPSKDPVAFIVYKNRKRGSIRKAQWISLSDKNDCFIARKFKIFRKKYEIRVTALDRLHNESSPCLPVTIKL